MLGFALYYRVEFQIPKINLRFFIYLELGNRSAILVDDGLASGFTMRVAVAALRNAGAGRIAVAVPTAHRHSAEMIAREVETLYCANIRGGLSYAVASAYRHWSDVAEEAVVKILEQFKTKDR
ncbi:MAG: hypothetical protein SRB2_03007 [Desulfobacteraceae bacterium Eth-SRB2]|nr:MAG: hypothetical protein SRB2_03007 [Desulfobacteraceae bacterium Eth-SRB2]